MPSSSALFDQAVQRGVSAKWIIESAKRYRSENAENGKMYIAFSDNWLRSERWEDFDEPSVDRSKQIDAVPNGDSAKFFAKKIRHGAYVAPSAISSSLAAEIVGRGLATPEQMKLAGFYV